MPNINKILIALSRYNLTLKLMCYAGDIRSDIYLMHKEYSGGLVSMLPCDEFYIMDDNADIVFIGNLTTLNNFINKYGSK